MKTISVSVSELEGVALDWAVAQVEGIKVKLSSSLNGQTGCWMITKPNQCWQPTARWRQLGPLIEKYQIALWRELEWMAACYLGSGAIASGGDHLIAASRVIVASKFGTEIEIPMELVE